MGLGQKILTFMTRVIKQEKFIAEVEQTTLKGKQAFDLLKIYALSKLRKRD